MKLLRVNRPGWLGNQPGRLPAPAPSRHVAMPTAEPAQPFEGLARPPAAPRTDQPGKVADWSGRLASLHRAPCWLGQPRRKTLCPSSK